MCHGGHLLHVIHKCTPEGDVRKRNQCCIIIYTFADLIIPHTDTVGTLHELQPVPLPKKINYPLNYIEISPKIQLIAYHCLLTLLSPQGGNNDLEHID